MIDPAALRSPSETIRRALAAMARALTKHDAWTQGLRKHYKAASYAVPDVGKRLVLHEDGGACFSAGCPTCDEAFATTYTQIREGWLTCPKGHRWELT